MTEILKLRDSKMFWRGASHSRSFYEECFRACIEATQRILWQQPEGFNMNEWATIHNLKYKDVAGFFPVSKAAYGAWGMKMPPNPADRSMAQAWHVLQTERMVD